MRRTRGVVALALVMAALLGGAVASGAPGGEVAREDATATLTRVLEQARRSTRLIEGRTRVRQLYRVRALGMTWEFSAWVTKEADAIRVRTEGAPRFIPEELSLALVEAFDLLAGYEPLLEGSVRSADGREAWVVRAVPRAAGPGAPGHGARLVRFWVERDTGLVTHLELWYWWGHLVIDQTYQRVGQYTVLDTQHVALRPLGITAEVRYVDYEFGPSPTRAAS